MGWARSKNYGKRNVYGILKGMLQGKKPLGKQKHRWVDTNKMDHKEAGFACMDRIDLTQDRYQWRLL
jgi:hypothetical protein